MLQNISLIILTIAFYECLKVYNENLFNEIRNNIKSLGIKFIYNLIYIYSFAQIKCNQLYNYALPFFNDPKKDCVKSETRVELFNTETHLCSIFDKKYFEPFEKLTDLSQELSNTINIQKFNKNLIIISELSNATNKCINKKIICSLDLENCDRKFVASEITFIALYLNYNDVRYNINLKTDNFNYYLVGNVINLDFLRYYVKYVLNDTTFIIKDTDTASYKLELMDHNVNMIELNAEQSIIIEKNGYNITNTKNSDELTIIIHTDKTEEKEETEKDTEEETKCIIEIKLE
jgi:hypothetical protein